MAEADDAAQDGKWDADKAMAEAAATTQDSKWYADKAAPAGIAPLGGGGGKSGSGAALGRAVTATGGASARLRIEYMSNKEVGFHFLRGWP